MSLSVNGPSQPRYTMCFCVCGGAGVSGAYVAFIPSGYFSALLIESYRRLYLCTAMGDMIMKAVFFGKLDNSLLRNNE